MLTIALVGAGLFSVGLGIAHLAVPVWIPFRAALLPHAPNGSTVVPLGGFGRGRWWYAWRRRDLMGITWVMSNATSYVILTIGLLDLVIAAGGRPAPVGLAGVWIAGWWGIRAASQLFVGHRRIDVLIGAWFLALAALHVWLAVSAG